MSETWNIAGLCRCCHAEGDARSLGASYSYENTNEIYSVMLREAFNIIISPVMTEHSASTYCICATCVPRLRDALAFRRQVLACEEKFMEHCLQGPSTYSNLVKKEEDTSEELKQEAAEIDDVGNETNEYDDKYLQMSDAELDDAPLSVLAGRAKDAQQENQTQSKKKYSCGFCEKRFSYNGSLEVHMKIHTGEKIYRCFLCDTNYGLNRDLTKHIGDNHAENGKYPCKICNKEIFDKPSKLRTHLKFHFEQKFKCDLCEKDFQRKKGLKEHLKVHSGERKYTCHICSKSFGHNQTLKTHILTHTGEKPYVCDVCGRRFPQRTHLKRHIFIIHAGVKPHSCNICNKQFSSKSYLTIHERVHSGEKPFSCEVCKKNFTAYTTLKVHMRVHTGFKPYTCSFCSRTFAQMASFKLHERTHTGAKPYSCEICKKRFSDNGYLKIHKRIHTNEKPFECEVCKRTFRETGQLKRHKQIHTGVKPYTCKICNKQIGNLSKHMRVHTDDRLFNCNICNKPFALNAVAACPLLPSKPSLRSASQRTPFTRPANTYLRCQLAYLSTVQQDLAGFFVKCCDLKIVPSVF
ncbi:zinc-finger double domain-containing protein [Phthorimaea operculella]|nr:zinc-finger double domain-containing protein [Phthorimaea operculella]